MIEVINREILIPREEYNIGTCYDDNTETRHFHLKRVTSGGVDLAALTFNLDIEYADGAKDVASLVKEVTDKDINLVLTVNNSMLQVPGTVLIQIRALEEDGVCKWTSYKSAFFVEDHINTPGHYQGGLTQLEQYEAEWGKVRDNVNQLNLRMDEVVRIREESPATEVEEEVIDARVGADNVVYGSLGSAIRKQFEDAYKAMEDDTENWTAAIAEEVTARADADAIEATARADADAIEATARADADLAEASARTSADNALQNQINNIVAPEGDPSLAEVANIRVGQDGTVYPTAGDAVRNQYADLKNALDNTYSDSEVLFVPPSSGGVVNSNGVISTTTTNSYYHNVLNVKEGELYRVTTKSNASSLYPYSGYFTDDDGVILKSFLDSEQAGVITEDVLVPVGVKKMYIMSRQLYDIIILKRNPTFKNKSDADSRYLMMQCEEKTLDFTVNVGGVQRSGGSVSISSTTQYKYAIIPCEKGKKYKIKVTQRHTSSAMASYPYYGFVVNSSLEVLKQFLSVDTTVTSGDIPKEEIIEIDQDTATYVYVMSYRDGDFEIKEYLPYWTNKISEIESNISSLNADVNGVPDSENMAQEGLAAAQVLNDTNAGISFVFVTDTHSNGVFVSDRGQETETWTYGLDSKLSTSVFRNVARTGMVDFGVHCGDIISAYNITKEDYIKTLVEYLKDYDGFRTPILFVKGNHECNHEDGLYTPGDDLTPTEYYSVVQRRDKDRKIVNPSEPFGGYYYCDFEEYKIRVIVLNAYIYPQEYGIATAFGETQKTWFENVALKLNGVQSADKWGVIVFDHPSASTNQLIKDLRPNVFSRYCPGTLIAYIHGHTHTDSYNGDNGYNNISVTRGFALRAESGAQRCAVSIFTAIPSITGDNSNGIIYETRIGRGTNRSFLWGDTIGIIETDDDIGS